MSPIDYREPKSAERLLAFARRAGDSFAQYPTATSYSEDPDNPGKCSNPDEGHLMAIRWGSRPQDAHAVLVFVIGPPIVFGELDSDRAARGIPSSAVGALSELEKAMQDTRRLEIRGLELERRGAELEAGAKDLERQVKALERDNIRLGEIARERSEDLHREIARRHELQTHLDACRSINRGLVEKEKRATADAKRWREDLANCCAYIRRMLPALEVPARIVEMRRDAIEGGAPDSDKVEFRPGPLEIDLALGAAGGETFKLTVRGCEAMNLCSWIKRRLEVTKPKPGDPPSPPMTAKVSTEPLPAGWPFHGESLAPPLAPAPFVPWPFLRSPAALVWPPPAFVRLTETGDRGLGIPSSKDPKPGAPPVREWRVALRKRGAPESSAPEQIRMIEARTAAQAIRMASANSQARAEALEPIWVERALGFPPGSESTLYFGERQTVIGWCARCKGVILSSGHWVRVPEFRIVHARCSTRAVAQRDRVLGETKANPKREPRFDMELAIETADGRKIRFKDGQVSFAGTGFEVIGTDDAPAKAPAPNVCKKCGKRVAFGFFPGLGVGPYFCSCAREATKESVTKPSASKAAPRYRVEFAGEPLEVSWLQLSFLQRASWSAGFGGRHQPDLKVEEIKPEAPPLPTGATTPGEVWNRETGGKRNGE